MDKTSSDISPLRIDKNPISSSVPFFVEFSEVGTQGMPAQELGGKAYYLAKMTQEGLPVPAGVILTGIPSNDLEWDKVLTWWRQKTDSRPLAIRSSFGAEDSSGHSFAGQNKTFLDVSTEEGIRTSVKECFESVTKKPAQAYASHFEVDSKNQRMNIVIQEMIEPLFSGVFFGKNPTNSTGWLLEFVEGLGEQLVSGQKTPFRLTSLSDTAHHPQWTSKMADNVVRAGRRVESLFGFAVDMEWCVDHSGVFHVLQARPITTATEPDTETQTYIDKELSRLKTSHAEGTVWDGRTFAEWTGFPSYLTFSLWKNAFEPDRAFGKALERIGYENYATSDLGKKISVLDRVFGRAYVNLAKLGRMYFGPIPYTIHAKPRVHLKFSFKEITLKNTLRAPLAICRMFSVGWKLSTKRKKWLADCQHEYVKFSSKFNSSISPKAYESLSSDVLLKQLEDECEAFSSEVLEWPFVLIVITESTMQSLLAHLKAVVGKQKANDILQRWMAHGVKTVTYEMHKSFRKAALDPSTRELFMAQYGHRGPSELDLSKPRWVEMEDQKAWGSSYGMAETQNPDCHEPTLDVKAEANALSPMRGELILNEWTHLKRLLEMREHWKMQLLKPYASIRYMARELGKRAGLGDEIFWLRLSEISKYKITTPESVPDSLRIKMEDRISRFKAFKRFHLPEFIELSELESIFSSDPSQHEAQTVLEGLSISPGLVKGTVRIVEDFEDANPEMWGENTILVADATDPGWTSLFVRAKGIIVAKGGALSHCAILARELGIPAVSEVTRCTEILKDGQCVWVDGNLGRIVHAESNDE